MGGQDQRRFPRIPSANTVLLKKLTEEPGTGEAHASHSTLEEFARTRSIGAGGCQFLADEPPGQGSLLELLIATGGRVISARGRAVYENPLPDGRYEVGVEFVQMGDPDRKILNELLVEAGVDSGDK